MVKSTSFLISQQCELINNEQDNKRNKRVHNILTEQINLLNNPASTVDTSSNTNTNSGNITIPKPIKSVRAHGKTHINSNVAKTKSSPIIVNNTKIVNKVKRVSKEVKKTNKLDKNFIELLTGENNTIQSEFNPTLRLREQVCQSHVMKSLGGYKFIEGNKFDNFVISILPKIENNKLISKY